MNIRWKTISFRVSEDYYNELKQLIADEYMSMSAAIRKAIKETYGVEEPPEED